MKQNCDRKLDISILLVEDETSMRDKISGMLSREVKNIYVAENGKEGLELFDRHRPDVVITDIKMPVMDGLEMARAIKAMDSRAHVIVVTAHGETGFLMSALEIGIESYMLKPVDMEKLAAKLERICTNIHLTEDLRHKNRLLEEYKEAVDESSIVCKTDVNGIIVYINDKFRIASGYRKKELLFQTYDVVLHANNQKSLLKNMQSTIQSKKIWKGILEHKKKNGSSYFADMTIVPLLDADDNIVEFIYIGHNVTEIVGLTRWLKQLSDIDALTQIYNRMAFNELLESEIKRAKRYGTELSFIMFDIDHFKEVNDNHGHLVGDEVLKTLSEVVSKAIRNIDTFARWGGEEFIILVPETGLEAAKYLAERLRIAIEEFDFGAVGRITASFGVATLRQDDLTDTVIKRADDALYMAKKNGRNSVETGD